MRRIPVLMWLILCIVLAFLFSFISKANATGKNYDCSKHPIYCQILNNKPNINRVFAFQLSNSIYKMSQKYDIPSDLMAAILAQETMYEVGKKNCTTGVAVVEVSHEDKVNRMKTCNDNFNIGSLSFADCMGGVEKRMQKTTICTDFGIGQIYYKTVESYEFDIDKLLNDMDYSVEAAFIVMKDFKNRYGKHEKFWWTRYNAVSKSKRDIYYDRVARYRRAK